jgi:hypothetical protein
MLLTLPSPASELLLKPKLLVFEIPLQNKAIKVIAVPKPKPKEIKEFNPKPQRGS